VETLKILENMTLQRRRTGAILLNPDIMLKVGREKGRSSALHGSAYRDHVDKDDRKLDVQRI